MTRLIIYSGLTILVSVWVFSSLHEGVTESPLGKKLEERRLLIESMSQ